MSAAIAPTQGVTLVTDGAARCVIVLPDAPSPAARRAAPILQSHLEQISGAKVSIAPEHEIKPDPKGPAIILVGEGKLSHELGFDTKGLGPGGILVEAKGNTLAILGTDQQTPTDPGGTLYAVSTFLEHSLGVRYLWPGESGKVVPKQRTIEIKDFKISSTPAMVQRHVRSMGYSDRLKLGMNRLRFDKQDYDTFQKPAYATVAVTPDWFTWQRLGGTLELATGDAFSDTWKKYGKEHPDWFALQGNGSRDQSASPDRARLCESNPELIAAIAKEKIEELKNKPTIRGVSLAPNDGGRPGFCMCPKCQALDAPNGRMVKIWTYKNKHIEFYDHVSLTDRMVYFWNAIAEQVTKVNPDALFVVDAYSVYTAPPVMRTLHPNFVVRFASLGYNDEAERQEAMKDWDGWAKAAKRIFFRSNLMLVARRGGMPSLYVHRFAEDFKHVVGTGAMGTDFDSCCQHWATEGLNYYVVAKLHWDATQNVDALIDDYCQSGFGPAAKTMRRFYDTEEQLFTTQAKTHESPYTDAVLTDLHKLIEQAKSEAAGDKDSLHRVEFVEQGLRYTELEVRAHRFLADAQHADKAAAKRVLDERYDLMRDIFQHNPLAVNVSLVSWGEDAIWAKLGYKFPATETPKPAIKPVPTP